MPERGEVALEVDADDVVPFGLAHRDQHPVADESGVVHQDVEAAEGLHGGADQPRGAVPARDVVAVGDGLAAEVLDLGHDRFGDVAGAPAAGEGGAEVVDDDLGALPRELQGVFAADPASGPGDDDDPAFTEHGCALLRTRCWCWCCQDPAFWTRCCQAACSPPPSSVRVLPVTCGAEAR
ncbi:hypothetical protein GCM10022221_01350 [Actinocorallia aurea]